MAAVESVMTNHPGSAIPAEQSETCSADGLHPQPAQDQPTKHHSRTPPNTRAVPGGRCAVTCSSTAVPEQDAQQEVSVLQSSERALMRLNPEGACSSAPAGAVQPWATRSRRLWPRSRNYQIPPAQLRSPCNYWNIISTTHLKAPKEKNGAKSPLPLSTCAYDARTGWH
jgi:hypothetical protein